MGCSPFDVDDLDVAVNSNVPKLLGSMLPPPSLSFSVQTCLSYCCTD